MAVVRMVTGWRGKLYAAGVNEHLHDLAEDVADDARRFAPVDTGALRVSINARGNKVWAGGDIAPYVMHVEFGTKPHVITPRNKKALYWTGAAHPVKLVRHPGTEAQPFLRPAIWRRR